MNCDNLRLEVHSPMDSKDCRPPPYTHTHLLRGRQAGRVGGLCVLPRLRVPVEPQVADAVPCGAGAHDGPRASRVGVAHAAAGAGLRT